MECRVEYDYAAQEDDELTLMKGDTITNVIQKMDGWWEGSLRGKTGMFPDNFVKVIEKPSASVVAHEPIGQKSIPKMNPVTLRNNANKTRRLKALFSYSPEQDDELRLEVGDEIEFITEVEEGWWRGKLRGKEGIFPSNFCSEYEPSANGKRDSEPKLNDLSRPTPNPSKGMPDVVPPVPTSDPPVDDDPAPELPPKPVREQARCFYPYKGLNEDELTMVEGDVVTIISKTCEDDGWWRGELKGKTGLFPDNFVKIITPNEASNYTKHPLNPMAPLGPKLSPQERNINASKPPLSTVGPKVDSKAGDNTVTNGTTKVDGMSNSKSKAHEEQESVSSKVARFSQLNFNPALKPTTPTSPVSPISLQPTMKKESSFAKDEENSGEFNSIERGEKLSHLTTSRAKAPRRRPPSAIITRDNEENGINGSLNSHESLDSPPVHHSTPFNLSVNSSGNITPATSIQDGTISENGSFSSNAKDQDTPASGNTSTGSSVKPKKLLPWMAELKQKQDKKQGLNTTGGTPNASSQSNTTSSPAGLSSSLPPVSPLPTAALQTKDKEPAISPSGFTKAPPLPAKPSTLATNNSIEKTSGISPTVVPNVPPAVTNRVLGKKPSATGQLSFNNQQNSFESSDVNPGGGGDSKKFVSYEEHAKLRDRVVILEAELETIRRQVKLLLDRELNHGHIV